MSKKNDKSDAVVATVESAQVEPTGEHGLQNVKQPEIIDITELAKAVGRYTILWRAESKQIAKLESVAGDEITYKMITGPDKDKRFKAKHFAKTIKVYDDDNLILATTE